jgi:hypothetical protein
MTDNAMRVVACPHPFSVARLDFQTPAGATVAELLGRCRLNYKQVHARVFLDDRLVHNAEWEHIRPDPGQTLTVRVVPTGGGGGGKDALRIVAMIGVVALAVALAQPELGLAAALSSSIGVSPAVGAAIIISSVGIVGSLQANSLLPPRPASRVLLRVTHG